MEIGADFSAHCLSNGVILPLGAGGEGELYNTLGIFNCYNHNGKRQACSRPRLRKLVNTILYFGQPCNPVTQNGLTQDAVSVQSELALSPQGMEVVEVRNEEDG